MGAANFTAETVEPLYVSDAADTEIADQWLDPDDVPYTLASGRLVVRVTEDAVAALIDEAATIDAEQTATVVLTAAIVTAAGFEALTVTERATCVWSFVLVRDDGRRREARGGPVVWRRGVVR